MEINPFSFLFRMLHRSKSFTIILVTVVRLFNYTTFSKKHIPDFSCSCPHLYIHYTVLSFNPYFGICFSLHFKYMIFFFFHIIYLTFIFLPFSFSMVSSSHLLMVSSLFVFFFLPKMHRFQNGRSWWVLSFLTCLECWGKWGGLVRFHHDEVLEFFFVVALFVIYTLCWVEYIAIWVFLIDSPIRIWNWGRFLWNSEQNT